MKQYWKKLGLVFCPSGEHSWLQTHASNPVVEHIRDDLFKVYFSSRDLKNRSQIASIYIMIVNRKARVLEGSIEHVLSHGKNGRFDDSGVTVTSLVKRGEEYILYFLGWNLSTTIPFRNAIGVAVSKDNGKSFVRISEAPIVDRNHIDPISISYPFLLWDKNRFRIWYGSCLEWDGCTVLDYNFSIKYAESMDGYNWERNGEVVLECDFPEEDAIARPHVIQEDGLFKMWYSKKKGPNYTIGYAESKNGYQWKRLDSLMNMEVTHGCWDSEMIEYPFVFDHKGERYMIYNGNGYGKTGFGLAVLDSE